MLNDLYKRVLYTIGLVILWRVLVFIPVPGVNLQALSEFLGDNGLFQVFFGYGSTAHEKLSIVAHGVMPYLWAYIVVEILSLFIQPLKSWREEGHQGRIKIKKIALLGALLLVFWSGYALADSVEKMVGLAGQKIVRNPGLSFRLICALTITAGTFIMIWIAELITKKGIGHGISILMLVAYGPKVSSEVPKIILASRDHGRSPLEYVLLFAIIVLALVAFVTVMEKGYRKVQVKFIDGTEAHIPLKLTPAGIMPVEWTSTLIMLPTTLLLLIKNTGYLRLPQSLMSTGTWYYVIYFVVTIFLYYLFTSFFYDPRKMSIFLKNKSALIGSHSGENEEAFIDRKLELVIPIAAVYLCLIIYVPNLLVRVFYSSLGGTGLIIAVAILLDLMGEARLRKKGINLVKIAELHDVPMAGLLRSLLEQKGLPCFLRGYYHRALLYFFGPYIEISVLVPESRVNEAGELVRRYIDPNLLTATGMA